MLWIILILILIIGLIALLVYEDCVYRDCGLGTNIVLGFLGSVAIILTVFLIAFIVSSCVPLKESDVAITNTTETQELATVRSSVTSKFELQGFSILGSGTVKGENSSAITISYVVKTDMGYKPMLIDTDSSNVTYVPLLENEHPYIEIINTHADVTNKWKRDWLCVSKEDSKTYVFHIPTENIENIFN